MCDDAITRLHDLSDRASHVRTWCGARLTNAAATSPADLFSHLAVLAGTTHAIADELIDLRLDLGG